MLLTCGAGEESWESLGQQGDQPVKPKGNHPWIFIGRTDAKAESPILWPPAAESQLIGKDTDAGQDWRQKEKRTTEGEMVRWHHWLNGHEFAQTPGDSEGKGSLVCYSYGVVKSWTWLSNWTTTANIYSSNIEAPQYIRKILPPIKGEINSNTKRDF